MACAMGAISVRDSTECSDDDMWYFEVEPTVFANRLDVGWQEE